MHSTKPTFLYQTEPFEALHTAWNGIGRRFNRLEFDTRILMVPAPETDLFDLFTTRTVYYSDHVHAQAHFLHEQIEQALGQIDRFHDQLSQLTQEFFEAIDFFAQANEALSRGINPLNDALFALRLNQFREYTQELTEFEQQSPRTYQYITALYQKYFYYLDTLIEILRHSNRAYLVIPNDNHWPEFETDRHYQKFRKAPQNALVRLLSRMIELLGLHTHILREITLDASPRVSPKHWFHTRINLSEGGLAVALQKAFQPHDQVDIFCLLPHTRQQIRLEGHIVRIDRAPQPYHDLVAVDFGFPGEAVQRTLRREIQTQELGALHHARQQLLD